MNIWDYTRDANRAENGAKMVLGRNGEQEIYVVIGRIHSSNEAFQSAVDRLKKTRQSELDAAKGDALQKLQSELTIEAAKRACVLGWGGFTHRDGTEMACTQENIDVIEKQLPELFDEIIIFGTDSTNYVGTFDEDAAVKN